MIRISDTYTSSAILCNPDRKHSTSRSFEASKISFRDDLSMIMATVVSFDTQPRMRQEMKDISDLGADRRPWMGIEVDL